MTTSEYVRLLEIAIAACDDTIAWHKRTGTPVPAWVHLRRLRFEAELRDEKAKTGFVTQRAWKREVTP